ncbi:MAG TPA: MerC domain-containing protein [Ignavibacteria bacterium]|nr:MerC domain-containing protein [Ignavibacteria bacterium]
MIKTIKHNLALKLDLLAFSASTICAIHCALMPFIIVFLPLMGMQFIANPVVEYIFIAISLFIGAFTFKHGYFNHHKKIYPFMLFLTGFSIILIGHIFFHDHSHELNAGHETIHFENLFLFIAPLGASIIAISHLVNRKLSVTPKNCCEQEKISADSADLNN